MAFTPLNALNSFIAVSRHRSFAAAARHLGVSTSALSQSVRQLEARLGVTLLTRTSRTVALTDAGQRLLENAGAAVDQALESLKTVSVRPGEVTGRVRFSVPASAVALVLARLLPRFIERYPKVEVEVQVENRFVNIVAEGLDAGIRLTEAIERDMVQVRLTDPGRFVVAAAPSYLARRGTPQKPQDLLQHDCLCIRTSMDGARYAWELERGRKTWRVPVQGAVTTNDTELMRVLAIAGVGLLYMFEPEIADELRRGSLRLVLEQYAAAVPGFFLYFPSRAQVSPALRAFVDVAASWLESRSSGQADRDAWREGLTACRRVAFERALANLGARRQLRAERAWRDIVCMFGTRDLLAALDEQIARTDLTPRAPARSRGRRRPGTAQCLSLPGAAASRARAASTRWSRGSSRGSSRTGRSRPRSSPRSRRRRRSRRPRVWTSAQILPLSNFGEKGLAPVGSHDGSGQRCWTNWDCASGVCGVGESVSDRRPEIAARVLRSGNIVLADQQRRERCVEVFLRAASQ